MPTSPPPLILCRSPVQAAVALARACPAISLRVFSDRDLGGLLLPLCCCTQSGRQVHLHLQVWMAVGGAGGAPVHTIPLCPALASPTCALGNHAWICRPAAG